MSASTTSAPPPSTSAGAAAPSGSPRDRPHREVALRIGEQGARQPAALCAGGSEDGDDGLGHDNSGFAEAERKLRETGPARLLSRT